MICIDPNKHHEIGYNVRFSTQFGPKSTSTKIAQLRQSDGDGRQIPNAVLEIGFENKSDNADGTNYKDGSSEVTDEQQRQNRKLLQTSGRGTFDDINNNEEV